MSDSFDLEAYLRRIGGPPPGDVRSPAFLQELARRHTESIPFENLDPWLGRPVHLDAAALQAKLVQGGRGGYCYEQNLLLRHALLALGLRVRGLAARVRWNIPEGVVRPRTHMLLQVDLEEGPYLVDVGFGGLTLTSALRLVPHVPQATAHERFRLVPEGEARVLQAELPAGWQALYAFEPHEQLLPDYEVYNWYVSTHPGSLFVTGLLATRPAPGRRYTLRNREFAVHLADGSTQRRTLASVAELREALEGPLGIRLPDDPRLGSALERHFSASQRP